MMFDEESFGILLKLFEFMRYKTHPSTHFQLIDHKHCRSYASHYSITAALLLSHMHSNLCNLTVIFWNWMVSSKKQNKKTLKNEHLKRIHLFKTAKSLYSFVDRSKVHFLYIYGICPYTYWCRQSETDETLKLNPLVSPIHLINFLVTLYYL